MSAADDPRDLLSLNAFLNAAWRENALPGARVEGAALRFDDPQGGQITVPIRARAAFRTRFGAPVRRNGAPLPIRALLTELAGAQDAAFAQRVAASLAAIRAAPEAAGRAERWSFIESEQALSGGHPLHPNPRSRDGMTEAEARIYAPEHQGVFRLCWRAVPRGALALSPGAETALRALAQADGAPQTQEGMAPVPTHPWQAPHIATQMEAAGGHALGAGRGTWRATSSLRAIHGWHAPAMLKFSMSLRLTNSVRILRRREVLRGEHISRLLAGPVGAEIATAAPGLHILREPHHAALTGANGPEDATLVSLRDNPFRDPSAPGPVLLASLCETPPEGVSPLGGMLRRLALNPEDWFAAFVDAAILPVLALRARWGLLFGAHQQNMALSLREGWPVGVWLRDCQGAGWLDTHHARLSAGLPDLGEGAENIVDAELGDRLLTYYVVVNSMMNTLATLALDGLARERALLGIWRAALTSARAQSPGERVIYDKLLDGPTLTAKANFQTSRSGVNETDGGADGQLAAFIDLPNPLAAEVPA